MHLFDGDALLITLNQLHKGYAVNPVTKAMESVDMSQTPSSATTIMNPPLPIKDVRLRFLKLFFRKSTHLTLHLCPIRSQTLLNVRINSGLIRLSIFHHLFLLLIQMLTVGALLLVQCW